MFLLLQEDCQIVFVTIDFPTVPEIRRVRQGRSKQLQARRELLALSAVHVPLEKVAVPAGVQQFARRDELLQAHADARGPHELADHGAADIVQLQLRWAAGASAARHLVHTARQNSTYGYVFPNPHIPWRGGTFLFLWNLQARDDD